LIEAAEKEDRIIGSYAELSHYLKNLALKIFFLM